MRRKFLFFIVLLTHEVRESNGKMNQRGKTKEKGH